MSILVPPYREDGAAAIKASIQSWIDQARPDISTSDLATLYATSVAAHRAGNLRASVVTQLSFKLKRLSTNEELPAADPLFRLLKRGMRDRMKRSELTLFAWGRNLIWKERSPINPGPKGIINLRWLNPYDWGADVDYWNGLKGFDIVRVNGRGTKERVRYVPLEDAIYTHYIDFKDDFDGVSPLEVCFMQANIDSALAEMFVALLRNMGIPLAIIQPAKDSVVAPQPNERNALVDFLRRTVQGVKNFGRTLIAPSRWEFLQLQVTDFDKLGATAAAQEAAKRVYEAADIPWQIVSPEGSTYAETYVAFQNWFQLWLKGAAEEYAEAYTTQLAHEFYGEDVVLEPDYSKLDFLKEDRASKTGYIKQQVDGTLRDLYSAQKALDIEPDKALKGFYMIQGMPVHVSDIPGYWREKGAGGGTTVPVFGGEPDTGMNILPPRPEGATLRSEFKASEGTPSGCVLVDLNSYPAIKAVQDFLKLTMQVGDLPIQWTPAHQFHMTLVYAPLVEQETYRRIYEATREGFSFFKTTAGPVDVFEQEDHNVLILKVEMNDELRALQRRIYEAFEAEGVPTSEYSLPDKWQAHITLAYMDKAIEIPTFTESIEIPISAIVFSRDDYKVEHFVVAGDAMRRFGLSNWIPDPVIDDLDKWRRLASRVGWNFEFTPRALPLDTAAYLRVLLHEAPNEDYVTDAFTRARRHYLRHHGGLVKAYGETEARYRSALYDLINRSLEGRIDRKAFGDLGRAEITTAFRAAIFDGLRSGGVNADVLDEDEERDLQLEIKAERGYWTAMANEIYRKVLPLRDKARELSEQARRERNEAEKDRLQKEALQTYGEFLMKREDLLQRIDVWVNKGLRRIYDLGILFAKGNQMQKWILGATEKHCRTCEKAAGQVHRAKDWKRKGILPRSGALECQGFRCDCRLVDTDEKASGRLDRIPVFHGGKHDYGDFDDDHALAEVEPVVEAESEVELVQG